MLADKLKSVVSSAGSRGLFIGGGNWSQAETTMDYIEISTPGNATDFGDCTGTRSAPATSNGSSERAIWAGGYNADNSYRNAIEYATISTPGNSTDFGDMDTTVVALQSCSNGTNDRGIFAGGASGGTRNAIKYVTISSTGNAASFGTLYNGYYQHTNAACSNGTNDRGVFFSGHGAYNRGIEYITISSTGNGADFGDTLALQGSGNAFGVTSGGSTSNTTGERGLYFGGSYATQVNIIQYITINSAGNSTDFGDLTNAQHTIGGTSSGQTGDTAVVPAMDTGGTDSSIDYFTISTTGNASTFGDLSVARAKPGATSNAD